MKKIIFSFVYDWWWNFSDNMQKEFLSTKKSFEMKNNSIRIWRNFWDLRIFGVKLKTSSSTRKCDMKIYIRKNALWIRDINFLIFLSSVQLFFSHLFLIIQISKFPLKISFPLGQNYLTLIIGLKQFLSSLINIANKSVSPLNDLVQRKIEENESFSCFQFECAMLCCLKFKNLANKMKYLKN